MIAGKRICSLCENALPLPDGITTTLSCQSCGSGEGRILSDFPYKYLRLTCKSCGETFLVPVNQNILLSHPICGGSIFTVESTADSLEAGKKLKKKKDEEIYSTTSIIIVTWNNVKLTKQCISSIRGKTKAPYQLIVVDNGSEDDTINYVQSNLKKNDILICNGENKGFSFANNQGMKHAIGDYILLLNNDTVVQHRDWIKTLIQAERVAGGLVGVNLRRVERDDVKGMFLYQGDGDYKHEWCYLEGWCLLAKRKLFEELEGFDERFFCYSEDADFSFRVRKELFKPLTEVKVQVTHIGQQTSSQLEKIDPGHSEASNRLLYRKWISNEVKRILVIRKGAIGDVLYSTPIVKALKKKYPASAIIYKTSAPELLAGNHYISQVVQEVENEHVFDKKFYLEYERRGEENLIDVMAEQAGVKLKSRKLVLEVPDKPIQKDLCDRFGYYVVMHTGLTWKSRQWDVENFAVVANYLNRKKYNVVLVGDRDTPMIDADVFDQRSGSWKSTIGIIDNCEFFFGIDSAPSVVAKALNKVTFIVYGCVDPETRYADTVEFPLYDSKLDCAGCRGRTPDTKVICSKTSIKCLESITPMKAIQKIGRYLKIKERGGKINVSRRDKRRRS